MCACFGRGRRRKSGEAHLGREGEGGEVADVMRRRRRSGGQNGAARGAGGEDAQARARRGWGRGRGAGEVVVGREGRSPATRGARRGRRLVGAAARGGGAAGDCRASVGAVVVRARGFANFGNEEAGAGRAHM